MRILAFVKFSLRCACLLVCIDASVSVAYAQSLRGRWLSYGDPLVLSLEFRAGDTVWSLVPVAAITANGRGTYEYAQGRLIMHYGEGLSETSTVSVRGDTLLEVLGDGRKQTWMRLRRVQRAQSPLQATWVGP